MANKQISARPLVYAMERLALRAGAAADDNESARIAAAFAQVAQRAEQAGDLVSALNVIAGQPGAPIAFDELVVDGPEITELAAEVEALQDLLNVLQARLDDANKHRRELREHRDELLEQRASARAAVVAMHIHENPDRIRDLEEAWQHVLTRMQHNKYFQSLCTALGLVSQESLKGAMHGSDYED